MLQYPDSSQQAARSARISEARLLDCYKNAGYIY